MSAHFDIPITDPPCDTCELAKQCASQKMVCEAYAAYCYGKKWQNVVRQPSHALYQRMYHIYSVEEAEKLEQRLARQREANKRTLESKGISTGRKRASYARRATA